MKILWTTIAVKDMEKSLHFYSKVLGLEVANSFKTPDNTEIAFLGSGETKLELICRPDSPEIQHGRFVSTGFQVASAQKTLELLAKHNIIPITEIVQPNPGVRFFFVEDPDGYHIQLVEVIK